MIQIYTSVTSVPLQVTVYLSISVGTAWILYVVALLKIDICNQ